MTPAQPTDADTALALLAWQLELGADEAIAEAPIDRFTLSARPEPAPIRQASPVPTRPADAPADEPADEPIVRTAAALAATATDLAALRAAIDGFHGSGLRLGARSLVFADGNPAARLMVVGEAPGRDEDLAGLPFVGRSGQLLDRMLAAIGLSRRAEDPARAVYITNVSPWRPPQNREPSADEAAMLAEFLFRHIELARPEILLAMGNSAAKTILATTTGITRLRGQWGEWRGIPVLPMLHPAALLRDSSLKAAAWSDLLAVKARLDG